MNRHPPGPTDNLLGLRLGRRFSRAPLKFLNQLVRDYGDLAMFRMGPYRACLVNHPDHIRDVLITHRDKLPKLPRHCRTISGFSGNSLFVTDGEFWLRQRRLVQPAFHARRMAGYGESTVSHARRIMGGWTDGSEIDLVPAMAELALTLIAQSLLNVDLSGQVELYTNALRVHAETLRSEFRSLFVLPDWFPIAAKRRKLWAASCLGDLVWKMIRERRESGRDHGDVLSMLLLAVDDQKDGGRMTDQQAHDEARLMLIAGQDDMTAVLSWSWYLLARHPEIETRFREEIQSVLDGRTPEFADVERLPFTQKIIKETLRLYPPTWSLVPRSATEEISLGEYRIPRGTWLIVSPWATHHDPRHFPDPEKFDPERFSGERQRSMLPYTYIPFGAGPRMCIANHFTHATVTLALATIAQRFRITLLDDPLGIVPDPSLALRPKGGMRVRLSSHQFPI